MQQRPDVPTLLDAVARFLFTELQPTVGDKRLAFRTLIAANLASTIAAELRTEPDRLAAELHRLSPLVPGVVPPNPETLPITRLRELSKAANEALTKQLREGTLSEEQLATARAHVKATLAEALAVLNPRFETANDLE